MVLALKLIVQLLEGELHDDIVDLSTNDDDDDELLLTAVCSASAV